MSQGWQPRHSKLELDKSAHKPSRIITEPVNIEAAFGSATEPSRFLHVAAPLLRARRLHAHCWESQQSGLELGLCYGDGLRRANNLDC
jgi:hypothetical protein